MPPNHSITNFRALLAAPKPVDLPVEGGEALKAATIEITLIYTTADPLG